jgi:hypothetical protein
LSDKTRYEKELAEALKKLPLPSEDAAWDDMSKLLDEEHDKVPPLLLYRSNIVIGSVIAALLIGTLLLFICNKKATDNKRVNDQTNNSTQLNINNSDSSNKKSSSPKNDDNEAVNNSTDKSTANIDATIPVNISSSTDNSNNTNTTTSAQPNKVDSRNNGEQITTISLTNSAVVTSATTIKANSNNLNHNNNSIKGNQINKKTTTSNKEINNNSAAPADSTEAETKNAPDKKASNKISNNLTSTSIAVVSAVSVSAKHKTSHTAIRLSGKTTAHIKSATTSNDDNTVVADDDATSHNIASADQTVATISSKNTTDVKSNNTVKHTSTKHTSASLPYYEQSTAAIAITTKGSKHAHYKKGNTTASTKANTQIKISSSNIEENDVVIDTTEMIKIGQSVLANKKAKHPPVIKKDTSTVKPLVAAVKDSSTKKKEKQLRITIGIAEQQAIRLNCDCVYPNDAYTKSALVTDYIPSVYVRIQPAKKWFVEAELKYKAPQYIQEQLYKTSVSDLPLNYTTSSYILKKVYYNQIPISFNYYIIPHLSIGVGVIYNNFAGQTTQQDVAKKLYGTAGNTDSIISSSIISNRSNDSSVTFTENSFQALVQSQYDWRRWSIGVRYAIGLQPYVKYNDPISGSAIQKTSNALTVFIRFELWDSKKKKKK